MDLQAFVRVLRKRWLAPVATTLVALVAAAAALVVVTPQYQSKAQFFVTQPAGADDPQAAYAGGLFTQQRVLSYSSVVTSPAVLDPVIDRLSLPVDADHLAERVNVDVPQDTVLINVTVTDSQPRRAQEIARGIAQNFVAVTERLERPRGGAPPPLRVSVSRAASLPLEPSSPKKLLVLVIGAFSGLLIGTALAFALEALDVRVRTPADIAPGRDIALLGSVPRERGRGPGLLESIRQIRTNLRFLNVDQPARSILITSALPGEGKSYLSTRLAVAMAQADSRVLLLEADLRVPSLGRELGTAGVPGLTDLLAGSTDVDGAIRRVARDGATFSMIPSGTLPPDPSELLGSDTMERLLDELRERYEIIVIDSPPLLPVTDSAVLARLVDGVVVTVRLGKTRKHDVQDALGQLDSVGAHTLGVVVNFATRERGYGSYYGTPGPAGADDRPAAASTTH